MMRWTGYVSRMEEKSLAGKPKGKRLFERNKRILRKNIKRNLKEIGWKKVDRSNLVQGDTNR
jgi:hypothetical protein